MSHLTYDQKCRAAARHQMPTLLKHYPLTVRTHLWQTGGFTMALGKPTGPTTYRMLTEETHRNGQSTFLVFTYDSDDDEGSPVYEGPCHHTALIRFLFHGASETA